MSYDITVFKARKKNVQGLEARYIAVIEGVHSGVSTHFRCMGLLQLTEELRRNGIALPPEWDEMEATLEEFGVSELSRIKANPVQQPAHSAPKI